MWNEILKKIGVNIKNEDNIVKFTPVLSIINDSNLDNKIKILKFHKIPILKLSQLKVFAHNSEELERRITISKSNNFFVDVMNDPLLLLDSSKYCFQKKIIEAVSPGYKTINPNMTPAKLKAADEVIEEKKSDEFSLFDQLAGEISEHNPIEFLGEIQEKVVVSAKEILNKPLTNLLDDVKFVKFEELTGKVNNILQTLDFDLISKNPFIDDNIMKLLVSSDLSDRQVLSESFSFNTNLNEEEKFKLDSVIDLFINENNTDNVLGKGVA